MHHSDGRQPAVLDASFWVNAMRSGVTAYLTEYFTLIAPPLVSAELAVLLGYPDPPEAVTRFAEWRSDGRVSVVAPRETFARFDVGENEAIALARERSCVLLIDNCEPRDYSRGPLGLRVVDSPAFVVFLYDQGRLDERQATLALAQSLAARRVVREALVLLATLARRKEEGADR
ncbi:MAG: hypothetical protein ACRDIY_17640 [Chloroflexota bacterium]